MKILWMSDSWHTISGFGSASRNIATYLHNAGHDMNYIGWQTFGQKQIATFHDKILGFKGLSNVGGKRFGEDAWKYWLPKIEPDIFITLSDFWMVLDVFKQNKLPYPWLMWYPIDGYPITDQMNVMLKKLDYRVCISEYGAKQVREKGMSTGAVPHGVNTNVFKPYHKNVIQEMKQKLGIPPNAFVVGRVDRNQRRKKVPRLMRSFVKFKRDFPDSVLLLWMDKRDTEGWDLEFIAKRLGLIEGKDVFFPPPSMMANFMYGVPELELAHVMNVIDIHGWTTGGEGFGLTGLETMACGTVNVATDYTTPEEIFGNWTCGVPIKVETFEIGNAGVDRALVDIDDCYAKMKYLRENLDEMKVLSDAGVKRAQEVYDWDVIGRRFDKYLRETVV
jgi:glycosyltransferase involved in cell wall biosynthesis